MGRIESPPTAAHPLEEGRELPGNALFRLRLDHSGGALGFSDRFLVRSRCEEGRQSLAHCEMGSVEHAGFSNRRSRNGRANFDS